MKKAEFVERMTWIESAARRADIQLAPIGELPEFASELIFWEFYLHQLDQFSQQTKCPHIGLILGKEIRYQDLGPHGHVLESAASSIEDFLEMMTRYSQTRQSVSHFEFKRLKRTARIYFCPMEFLPLSLVEADLALAGMVQLLRNYLGSKWTPRKTNLQHAGTNDILPYQEIFGGELKFSQKSNFIEFDTRLLSIAINESNPLLHQTMRDYAQSLMQEAGKKRHDVSAQLKLHFINKLGKEKITQDSLASSLSISRATLQRRLEAEGTSYRSLRNEVVSHLARRQLKESDVAISVISDRLGFSDPASFTRAFYALEGITPLAYRKNIRESK